MQIGTFKRSTKRFVRLPRRVLSPGTRSPSPPIHAFTSSGEALSEHHAVACCDATPVPEMQAAPNRHRDLVPPSSYTKPTRRESVRTRARPAREGHASELRGSSVNRSSNVRSSQEKVPGQESSRRIQPGHRERTISATLTEGPGGLEQASRATAGGHMPKDSPQAHVRSAWGLEKWNPSPCSPSVK